MTTNKPEVVAWMKPAPPTMNSVDSVITAKERRGASRMTLAGHNIALVRLSDYEALQAECEALRKDAGRLDFLDARNRPLKMGWSVSDAPAGNVSIMSIMSIGGREPTSIRSAIDAAMAKEAHP